MFKWILPILMISASAQSAETKVLAFAGSTRDESVNKKLVIDAATVARQMGGAVTIIDLNDYPMPFYDADLEAEQKQPPKAQQLRQLMMQSQVIYIASPEYNGSLSGVLKNAIDWASRSAEGAPSRDAFAGKKFVIMSASPGQGGGARGLAHLRSIIENVGGTVLAQQIVVPNAYSAFDEQGKLRDQKQQKELETVVRQSLNK